MSAVKKQKLSKTKQVLIEMLTENTGTHFLDSGGVNGRNWQRNQGLEWEAMPESRLSVSVYDVNGKEEIGFDVSHNIYHWLERALEYDGHMNQRFQNFCRAGKNADANWLENMEQFPLHLRTKGVYTSYQGDETDSFPSFNSYEGESMVSQGFQCVFFDVEKDGKTIEYVALQIHGGCDVRGGYTRPRIFRHYDEMGSLFNTGDGTLIGKPTKSQQEAEERQLKLFGPEILPDPPDMIYWTTDNGGYHWRADFFNEGHGQLEDFPRSTDLSLRGKGVLVVEKDTNTVYCPVTGWKLTACF